MAAEGFVAIVASYLVFWVHNATSIVFHIKSQETEKLQTSFVVYSFSSIYAF